jgi:hypothetical protein
MATATSRPIATAVALAIPILALTVSLTACGGGVASPSRATRTGANSTTTGEGAPATGRQFAWLRPSRPPPGWPLARIPAGATMPYPAGWRRIHSDPGTASAAVFDARHGFLGYLNLTPRQGAETASGWARFRIEHNADEHERSVTALAAATGLRFRTGSGACVRDTYTTANGSRYIELACLVSGRHASVVVVGASPPRAWGRISPLLERAISSVVA